MPVRELSTELRHNLFLAAKEALTQHRQTRPRHRGLVPGKRHRCRPGTGHRGQWPGLRACRRTLAGADGLRNMRQRMAEIGGECRIESRPGAGTRVLLRLPWR